MALAGNIIRASDGNALKSLIEMLIGTGSGDVGYGQVVSMLDNVRNTKVTPAAFPSYANALAIAIRHQTGGTGDTGPSTFVNPVTGEVTLGQSIDNYETLTYALTGSRWNYQNPSMTLYNNVFASVMNYWWGPRRTISTIIDAVWNTEDKARFFFNSGGDIRFNLSQPTWSWITTSFMSWGHAVSYSYRSGAYYWNIGLPLLGTVLFKAHNTSNPGASIGNISSTTGYYEMGGSYVTILNGSQFYNPYAYRPNYPDVDSVYIQAMKVDKGVRFKISLTESNANQSVDPGTRVDLSYLKATTYLTNPTIDSPTFILRQSFQ